MEVILQYAWFGPDAHYFPKGYNIIPDRFKDQLPPTAEIVGKAKYEEPLEPEEGTLLRHVDGARAAADAIAEVEEKAEKAYRASGQTRGRVIKD